MDRILEIRERIKAVYSRYSMYADMVLRFLLALFTFITINGNIGFHKQLSSPLAAIALSVVCALLPMNFTVLIAVFLTLFQLIQVSMEAAAVAAVLMLIMYIFYFRFAPKNGYMVLLTPVAFTLNIPYVIPLGFGLSGGPLNIVPMSCGVVLYYVLHYVKVYSSTLNDADGGFATDRLSLLLDNIFRNPEMLLVLLAFVVTLTVVYIIRRMSVDHAWKLAIGCGAVLDMAILFIGDFALDIETSFLGLIAGTIISALAALVLEFFLFSVDYTRAEKVQFEDDEYYYYVKAVPKVSIAQPEKKIQKINTKKEEPKEAASQQANVIVSIEDALHRTAPAEQTGEGEAASEEESAAGPEEDIDGDEEELRYLEQIIKEKQEEFLNRENHNNE